MLGRKGRRSGKKGLRGGRGEKILGRKREKLPGGGKALGGKGGKGSQQGKGGKDVREKLSGGKRT